MSFTDSRNLTITQRFLGCIESLAKMEDHTHVVGTHMKVFDCGNEGWLNPDLRFCEMTTAKRNPKVCLGCKMALVEAREPHNRSWKEVKGRLQSFYGLGGKGSR